MAPKITSGQGINNAMRLAKTRPITFEKGLIRTDSNDILGYVSDLNNMEIDKNGNVRRRKGTVAMNSGKLNEKWYFLESYQIAGVNILFGLSYKRELWAWIDSWPEVDFKVCDKNTYGRFPHYNASSDTPKYNTWVSFSRGSSFHVLRTDRHLTIVNNLNDAIRIYAKGCFAVAKYQEDNTKQFIKEDIETARKDSEVQLGIYVSIKDVTNKIMKPAVMVKTDDRHPLIEGTVQFASVNEEGVAGRFTDLEKIDRSSPYFSIFKAEHGYKNKLVVPKKTILEADPDGGSDVNYAVYKADFGDNYGVNGTSYDTYRDFSGDTKESYVGTIVHDYDEDKYWLIFMPHPEAAPHQNKITSATQHSFFKISNIQTYFAGSQEPDYVRYRNLGDSIICLTGSHKFGFGFRVEDISTVLFDGSDVEFDFTMSSAFTSQMWYEVDAKYCKLFDTKSTPVNIIFTNGPQTFNGSMIHFTMDVFRDPSTIYSFDLNQVAIDYDSFVLKSDSAVFEHLGFNTWTVSEYIDGPILSSDIITIDNQMNLEINKSVNDALLVDNTDQKAKLFLENGYKWCVKNLDTIVAYSQTGFLNQNKTDIMYSMSASIDGIPKNMNDVGFDVKPCYMPVISLHGSSLLKHIDQDKNKEVFYDVQFAFNINEQLLVIQDGALWIGNTDTLKLTYDKAIQGSVLSADKFYDGLLIGTTEGIFYYNNNKIETVIDGQSIKALRIKSGVSGAMVIDETGTPYYCIAVANDEGLYAKLIDISSAINDLKFTDTNIVFVSGNFYLAYEDKIFRFYINRGADNFEMRWDEIQNYYGQKIGLISSHNGQLVVSFETGAVKSEMFEQPYEPDN